MEAGALAIKAQPQETAQAIHQLWLEQIPQVKTVQTKLKTVVEQVEVVAAVTAVVHWVFVAVTQVVTLDRLVKATETQV